MTTGADNRVMSAQHKRETGKPMALEAVTQGTVTFNTLEGYRAQGPHGVLSQGTGQGAVGVCRPFKSKKPKASGPAVTKRGHSRPTPA